MMDTDRYSWTVATEFHDPVGSYFVTAQYEGTGCDDKQARLIFFNQEDNRFNLTHSVFEVCLASVL
jgi:hypothetical protein